MALQIRDERTVALVREPASRRGIGLAQAARRAVENELAREARRAARRRGSRPPYDRFNDSLNDEDEGSPLRMAMGR